MNAPGVTITCPVAVFLDHLLTTAKQSGGEQANQIPVLRFF